MPAAAVTGAVGLYSAHQASNANEDAVNAQQQGSADAIAEQRREFDLLQAGLQPYTGAGTNALAQLSAVNSGNYSGFENSPDYLYARDQAQYVIDHGAAAAGSLYSGGHSLDLGREIAGIASQNFTGYRNNLMQLAGLGQASAAGVGAAGMNMADNIGGYLGDSANAASAGYQNQAAINGQLAAGLGGTAVNWWNSRPENPPPAATSTVPTGWGESPAVDYSNWDFGA